MVKRSKFLFTLSPKRAKGLQKDLFTDLNLASFRMHTLLLRVFPSLNFNYLQLLNAASI